MESEGQTERVEDDERCWKRRRQRRVDLELMNTRDIDCSIDVVIYIESVRMSERKRTNCNLNSLISHLPIYTKHTRYVCSNEKSERSISLSTHHLRQLDHLVTRE